MDNYDNMLSRSDQMVHGALPETVGSDSCIGTQPPLDPSEKGAAEDCSTRISKTPQSDGGQPTEVSTTSQEKDEETPRLVDKA